MSDASASAACTSAAGPERLLQLKRQYLVPCVYHFYRQPPQIVAGQGCHLIDSSGKRYLDCYSGVTVMSAGHAEPAIIEPAIEQIRTLQHTTTIYLTEPILRLAERLAGIAPGLLCRSFFCASGTEAVEGALLTAALHTGRRHVIALQGGLHGRTRWAMNVTGLDMWRTDPFPLEGVTHVPFGDYGALQAAMATYGSDVAAVLGEPIQGNGGIRIPPPDYWPRVRELCDESGALLVLDEVQTGLSRTGHWFACQHWNITPDLLVTSKALGNGFPIAAFITTDAIAESYTRPGASTYGGNPVCATAALAVIDYHERNDLARRSAQLGEQFLVKLQDIVRSRSCLSNPRGRGLMIGVDVVNQSGSPDPARLDDMLDALKDCGFLCGKTGRDRDVLTLMPPLVIDEQSLDALLNAIDGTAASLG